MIIKKLKYLLLCCIIIAFSCSCSGVSIHSHGYNNNQQVNKFINEGVNFSIKNNKLRALESFKKAHEIDKNNPLPLKFLTATYFSVIAHEKNKDKLFKYASEAKIYSDRLILADSSDIDGYYNASVFSSLLNSFYYNGENAELLKDCLSYYNRLITIDYTNNSFTLKNSTQKNEFTYHGLASTYGFMKDYNNSIIYFKKLVYFCSENKCIDKDNSDEMNLIAMMQRKVDIVSRKEELKSKIVELQHNTINKKITNNYNKKNYKKSGYVNGNSTNIIKSSKLHNDKIQEMKDIENTKISIVDDNNKQDRYIPEKTDKLENVTPKNTEESIKTIQEKINVLEKEEVEIDFQLAKAFEKAKSLAYMKSNI